MSAPDRISEHGTLFKAPLVRAILDGTKWQTRRLVTPWTSLLNGAHCSHPTWQRLDFNNAFVDRGPSPAGNPGPYLQVAEPSTGARHRVYPRVMVGDRLWVRETWDVPEGSDDPREVVYRADFTESDEREAAKVARLAPGLARRWRPSLHMPRWASRLTLDVTRVRVEPLQEITEAESAEGAPEVESDSTPRPRGRPHAQGPQRANGLDAREEDQAEFVKERAHV
jgi:hypothetical protein